MVQLFMFLIDEAHPMQGNLLIQLQKFAADKMAESLNRSFNTP